VLEVASGRGAVPETAPRLAHALADVPPERWGAALVIPVARGLREAGLAPQARALLASAGRSAEPNTELILERALDQLRDGPDAEAIAALGHVAGSSPEAAFGYAEALFFSGQSDSAHAWYDRVSHQVDSPSAGAALERMYLIEEADPREALPAFGRLAWQEW